MRIRKFFSWFRAFWEQGFFKTRLVFVFLCDPGPPLDIFYERMSHLDLDWWLSRAEPELARYLVLRKDNPAWVFFAYVREEVVLGYSFLHVPHQVEWNDSLATDPGQARIGSNFVYPEFRGKGIRGAIHKAQFHYCNRRGLKTWCVVEKNNTASMKAELKTGKIVRRNFLLKFFGKNIISILTSPFEIHFLTGAKAARR